MWKRELYKGLIEAVYRRYNKEKLGDVGMLMDKYQGQEADIYDKIVRKYVFCETKDDWFPLINIMYIRFNPTKLDDIERILRKYFDSEAALYRALCDKYLPSLGPDDPPLEMNVWSNPVRQEEPLQQVPKQSQTDVQVPKQSPTGSATSAAASSHAVGPEEGSEDDDQTTSVAEDGAIRCPTESVESAGCRWRQASPEISRTEQRKSPESVTADRKSPENGKGSQACSRLPAREESCDRSASGSQGRPSHTNTAENQTRAVPHQPDLDNVVRDKHAVSNGSTARHSTPAARTGSRREVFGTSRRAVEECHLDANGRLVRRVRRRKRRLPERDAAIAATVKMKTKSKAPEVRDDLMLKAVCKGRARPARVRTVRSNDVPNSSRAGSRVDPVHFRSWTPLRRKPGEEASFVLSEAPLKTSERSRRRDNGVTRQISTVRHRRGHSLRRVATDDVGQPCEARSLTGRRRAFSPRSVQLRPKAAPRPIGDRDRERRRVNSAGVLQEATQPPVMVRRKRRRVEVPKEALQQRVRTNQNSMREMMRTRHTAEGLPIQRQKKHRRREDAPGVEDVEPGLVDDFCVKVEQNVPPPEGPDHEGLQMQEARGERPRRHRRIRMRDAVVGRVKVARKRGIADHPHYEEEPPYEKEPAGMADQADIPVSAPSAHVVKDAAESPPFEASPADLLPCAQNSHVCRQNSPENGASTAIATDPSDVASIIEEQEARQRRSAREALLRAKLLEARRMRATEMDGPRNAEKQAPPPPETVPQNDFSWGAPTKNEVLLRGATEAKLRERALKMLSASLNANVENTEAKEDPAKVENTQHVGADSGVNALNGQTCPDDA